MMLKRILAAVMSAAIILALSSCGKDEPERPEPELTEDGKKIVKMYARMAFDTDIYDSIRNFNARSDEYEVQLTELTVEYGGDGGTEKFNADMAAGNYPDIFLYNWEGNFPIESYAQKGLLANLYDFMDADPDINREDFLESALKAYERNGELYTVVPEFFIYTLVGKTSIVGEQQEITMDRIIELVNEYPDKPFRVSKNEVLSTFVEYGYNSYIDSETGKCRFDNDEFIKLLEFCSQFPEETEPYGEYDWYDEEYALINGTMPFTAIKIYEFGQIRDLERGTFGEPVTFMGFPGVGGNGSVILSFDAKYSIFAKGANPEGAWEFLKYFYSEAYQDKIIENVGDFPIRKSTLEKLESKSRELIKEYGTNEIVEPFTYVLGNQVTVGINTDEDSQKIYDLLNGAVAGRGNYNVTDIITEEAAAYFAGQKSAEDVAKIIQNRVQNYLDENR